MKFKRILAWIGIIFLISMYIITLFMAIFDKSATASWFMASIFSTIVIPIILWIYIKCYEWSKRNSSSDE